MNDQRYIRQLLLDKIGESGQQKLQNAHVAIVGCGGLGSIAGPYLAGAGVGKLTLIDGDVPDLSNLHRQVFFKEGQSESKSQILRQHILELNPTIEVFSHDEMISKSNIDRLLSGADLVLECTDNINVKYLVNDYCHLNHKPMVYGAIHKYDGFVSFFENVSRDNIQLRDIFPDSNIDIPSCSEVGVLGTLAGLIGLLQANEAIKFLTNAGKTLSCVLLSYDILTSDQMKLKLKKTWKGDIKKVFEDNTYEEIKLCEVNEVLIDTVRSNRSAYELISILEDHEYSEVDSEVVRQPLSNFDIDTWRRLSSKPHVFYCLSGKRSGDLVSRLNKLHPDLGAFSLKNGISSVSITKNKE